MDAISELQNGRKFLSYAYEILGWAGPTRDINIQRAEWGTTPHAGSGGVETPTIKVRGPLEHVPSLLLCFSPPHALCACGRHEASEGVDWDITQSRW